MSGGVGHDRALAWRQLLRAGNVFTAISNVLAGFLIVEGSWTPVEPLVALMAASALLYAAGMVLNDAFDADVDAVERPERPIPSGRISRSTALGVGWTLLAGGVACSALAAWLTGFAGPLIVGTCLAVMIVMYDGGLKNTWAGPLAMGWCRTLNVLLGGSLVHGFDLWLALGVYALAVGVYTIGLTLIAQGEVRYTKPRGLAGDYLLFLACSVLFGWPWVLLNRDLDHMGFLVATVGFFAFMFYVGVQLKWKAGTDDPAAIRGVVKRLIIGFILIDACAAAAVAGIPYGLAVLALVAPSLLAARRAPMT